MILIEKNKPDKALCCECRRLYEPTVGEWKEAEKRPHHAFICQRCVSEIIARSNPRKRGIVR